MVIIQSKKKKKKILLKRQNRSPAMGRPISSKALELVGPLVFGKKMEGKLL